MPQHRNRVSLDYLRFCSSQAPKADEHVQADLEFLCERLVIPIEFVTDSDWKTGTHALDNGDTQMGWICGLPYVWRADAAQPVIELLVAPAKIASAF